MRDYLLVKRSVDPTELEKFRMTHMSQGYAADHGDTMMHNLAYVSFQELATRVSHRNTGKYTDDPMADRLLARIAADENLHMIFYRNLMAAAIELSPDQAMQAILDVVTGFKMPGSDIPGFQRKAVEMAVAGIYDLRSHRDEVVMPVLRFWKVFEMEGLSAGGRARAHGAGQLHGRPRQAGGAVRGQAGHPEVADEHRLSVHKPRRAAGY